MGKLQAGSYCPIQERSGRQLDPSTLAGESGTPFSPAWADGLAERRENMTTDTDRAEGQAKAQLQSIREMVKALEDGEEYDGQDAEEAIQEDPLEVSVRADWHSPGDEQDVDLEYKILLCTGGPAVRIVGDLGRWKEPDNARLQYQDWGTGWETLYTDDEEDDALLTYARQFYFGE